MIYENKNVKVSLENNGTKKFILFKWFHMFISKPEIVDAHTKASEVAQKNGVSIYVADVQNAKSVLPTDVIEWWGGWSKFLVKIGIKKIITIKKTDGADRALRNINDKSWQRESQTSGGIEHVDINSSLDLRKELNK